jgi:hypothetical protein
MVAFLLRGQFNGSSGESLGCGCRTMPFLLCFTWCCLLFDEGGCSSSDLMTSLISIVSIRPEATNLLQRPGMPTNVAQMTIESKRNRSKYRTEAQTFYRGAMDIDDDRNLRRRTRQLPMHAVSISVPCEAVAMRHSIRSAIRLYCKSCARVRIGTSAGKLSKQCSFALCGGRRSM